MLPRDEAAMASVAPCKRLRELCLPLMFKRVVCLINTIKMLRRTCHPAAKPCGVLQYVCQRYIKWLLIPSCCFQELQISLQLQGYHYIDELIYAIPRLSRLRIFHTHLTTTAKCLMTRCSILRPSRLSFEETPLDFRLPRVPCESLHTLRFKRRKGPPCIRRTSIFIRSCGNHQDGGVRRDGIGEMPSDTGCDDTYIRQT